MNQRADCAVRVKLTAVNSGRGCGRISAVKPDNVIRMIYENFSSLGLFAEGPSKHKKIRHINKLMKDYEVDLLAGVETRTD